MKSGRPGELQYGMALLAALPRPPLGLTPHRIVHTQDKLVLRHYPAKAPRQALPVVVVPSLINRATICDLEPDRSLVGGLAERGHPTYLVDWGVPGPEDAHEDVAYLLLELLHRAIDRACRDAGAPGAVLLGYCQGGTLAAMYAALRPRRVRGLIALAAPIRFSEGGRFRDFTNPAHFDFDAMLDAQGLVPVEWMKAGFQLLDPMGIPQKFVAVARASRDPVRLRRVLARERWLEENVPVSGAFAREFIRNTYQGDRLEAGTWFVGGEQVDLGAITAPTLVLACQRDFICPAASALPLAELVGSEDVQVELLETGHIGAVVGRYGPEKLQPLLDRWLRRIQ
jgi:polyhydroxyalkanoate synthase